jgi:putative ABC transport system substrate-binding protein
MKRREFISVLSGAAAGWPVAAWARQPAMPVIGYLSATSFEFDRPALAALRQGLKENGFIDGQNVAIEYRGADGQYGQLPSFVADFVLRQVAVIFASGLVTVQAAKAGTSTIPIVFVVGSDPVKDGLVANFNQPGGNMTGVSWLGNQLAAKRLALLHELVPSATVIALIVNPKNASTVQDLNEVEIAAGTLGLKLIVLTASNEAEIDTAFAGLIQQRASALFVLADSLLRSQKDQLVALAARHAIPASYSVREFAAAGGLMSYGPGLVDAWQQGGIYVARILKGDKAANLPVMQSTKFELVINLKTAKALGITVPPTLLAHADEVIE